MKVAIVGSRDYPLLEQVRQYVRGLDTKVEIVSGGARGVDTVAVDTARERHMRTLVIPAEWDKYGKSAGYKRNLQLVDHADKVVAFWDGKSKGTKHTIDIARNAGKPVTVYMPQESANE